jgi:hypothetical protein
MSKKIGWQKYEDMLKKQISSPLGAIMLNANLQYEEEENGEEEYESEFEEDIMAVPVPVPDSFYEQISLITNYDCWLGHANFDITPSIKKDLEKVTGVEVLKICSRYRFFLGVGQMFNFSDVRKNIEELIN